MGRRTAPAPFLPCPTLPLLAILSLLVMLSALIVQTVLAAAPLAEDGGNITLDNANGQVTAGVTPSNSITVTFRDPGTIGDAGGGGGTGDAATDETNACAQTVPSASHFYDLLTAGKAYTVTAPSGPFLLEEVRFTAAVNATQVLFRIGHVMDIACESAPPVSSDLVALGYDRLDHIGIRRDEATGITLTFDVPAALLAGKGATLADVRFLRYDGQNWQRLTAKPGNATGRFIVDSPGLSYYAVAVPAPQKAATPSTGEGTGNQVTGAATGQQDAGDAGWTGPGIREEADIPPEGKGSPYPRLPLISILILVLIGGAVIAYYAFQSKEPEQKPLAQQEKQEFGFVAIDDEAFEEIDADAQLRTFVATQLDQGVPLDAISSQLAQAGWPAGAITDVLGKAAREGATQQEAQPVPDDRLAAFIREKLDLGYPPATIRESLVNAGWQAAPVDAAIAESTAASVASVAYAPETLQQLRDYISAARANGYADGQIRSALAGAGWDAAAVEKELK